MGNIISHSNWIMCNGETKWATTERILTQEKQKRNKVPQSEQREKEGKPVAWLAVLAKISWQVECCHNIFRGLVEPCWTTNHLFWPILEAKFETFGAFLWMNWDSSILLGVEQGKISWCKTGSVPDFHTPHLKIEPLHGCINFIISKVCQRANIFFESKKTGTSPILQKRTAIHCVHVQFLLLTNKLELAISLYINSPVSSVITHEWRMWAITNSGSSMNAIF